MKRHLFLIVISFYCVGVAAAQGDSAPLPLTLREALKKAYEVNPQVIMADARVEQALARIGQARAALLPNIDGVVSGSRQTRDLRGSGFDFPGLDPHVGPFNSFDARPRLTVSLFDPAALQRLHAAQKGQQLSYAQNRKVRDDVLALVASLYVQAKRSAQTYDAAALVLKRDSQALQVMQTRQAQGSGSSLDLKKAESDVAQSSFLFQRAQTQMLEDRVNLAAALKLPIDVPITFTDDKNDEELLNKITALPADEKNPDVKLAMAQIESQKAEQAAASAAFWPRITGMADYGRSGSAPDDGSNTYMIGVQATIPIWEGGFNQSKLKEAKAQVKEAQANLDDILVQDQAKLMIARQALQEAFDMVKAKQAQTSVIEASLQITQARLDSGTGSSLDLIQAQAAQALAQDEANEAQAYVITAQVNVAHALGKLQDIVKEQK